MTKNVWEENFRIVEVQNLILRRLETFACNQNSILFWNEPTHNTCRQQEWKQINDPKDELVWPVRGNISRWVTSSLKDRVGEYVWIRRPEWLRIIRHLSAAVVVHKGCLHFIMAQRLKLTRKSTCEGLRDIREKVSIGRTRKDWPEGSLQPHCLMVRVY